MGNFGLFLVGLAVLVVAAELVVRGATRLASSLGVQPFILGLTVVAIGTSMPELAVGITAGLQGAGSLAVGNIAGTNMVNILLILGLSALIRPLPLHLQVLKLDLPMVVAAAALMTVFAWDGVLSRLEGAIMVLGSVGYTLALLRVSRHESRAVKEGFKEVFGTKEKRQEAIRARGLNAAVLMGGLLLSVGGAELLVRGATGMALALGASEAVIGLTVVAIGTSSPELVTTIVATLKDERDVAVGNLLGSSIYNILVILGITCLVPHGGIPVERSLLTFDIPLMGGVALACIPVFITGKRVSRFEGGLFVTAYVAYLVWLLLFRP